LLQFLKYLPRYLFLGLKYSIFVNGINLYNHFYHLSLNGLQIDINLQERQIKINPIVTWGQETFTLTTIGISGKKPGFVCNECSEN